MKVNVNVTLDVDPEAWAIEFGLDQADKVIRKDVKTYFAGLCHDQLTVLQLGNREASFAGRTGTSPDGSLRHLQARPRRAASCRPGHDFVTNFVKWGMGTFLVGLPIAILILVVMCW